MRELSATLLATQQMAPIAEGRIKVEVKNKRGSVRILHFDRLYEGAEQEFKHAVTMPGDGSLIRARIQYNAPSTYILYRQRVTSPDEESDYSTWTSLGEVGWTAGTALCSQGANVLHFWVDTDCKTIKYQESTDYGASWGVVTTLYVPSIAIYHMAAAMKPNGDVCVIFWEVDKVYALKRTSGVWGAVGMEEYYATGDDTGDTLIQGDNWQAQTFTTQDAYTMAKVKLKLYRSGNPGIITVSIKATDVNGHPTGDDLCSGTTDGDTLTTDTAGEEREIPLTPGYALAISTKYAIVVRCAAGTTAMFEYYNTGGDTQHPFRTNVWPAQTFTPQIAHTITKVKLKLYRQGSPTGGHIALRATDASGHPTGANLAVCNFDPSTITTDYPGQWYEFTFSSSYGLSADTKYAIVAYTDTGDNSNRLYWRCDSSSPTYTGGCEELSVDSGVSWTTYIAHDYLFEEWGIDTSSGFYWREDASSPTYAGGYVEVSANAGSSWTGYGGRDKWFRNYGGEAFAWTNDVSICSSLAIVYHDDWNIIITGRDTLDNRSVWICVFGDGNQAPLNTWTALQDIMVMGTDTAYDYRGAFIDYLDEFRAFWVELRSSPEEGRRVYWTHSLPTHDFIDNLWREPIPFNYGSEDTSPNIQGGIAICHSETHAWLSTADGVWRAARAESTWDVTSKVVQIKQWFAPQRYQSRLSVVLDNTAGLYNSFDKLGYEVIVYLGYKTAIGSEYSPTPSCWVTGWKFASPQWFPLRMIFPAGVIGTLHIEAETAWDILEGHKARRLFEWSPGQKSVKQLLQFVLARAGFDLVELSSSDAINNFKPEFKILEGYTLRWAVKKLLSYVDDIVFQRGDTFYLKQPQAADAVDYTYDSAFGNAHIVYRGEYGLSKWDRNRAQVWGTNLMVERYDFDQIEAVYDDLSRVEKPIYPDTTRAAERALIELRKGEMWTGSGGWCQVPTNCGQEIFDVIKITDRPAGVYNSKRRVLGIYTTYNKLNWQYIQKLNLGMP
jgi:hypothetical protein